MLKCFNSWKFNQGVKIDQNQCFALSQQIELYSKIQLTVQLSGRQPLSISEKYDTKRLVNIVYGIKSGSTCATIMSHILFSNNTIYNTTYNNIE